MNSNRLVLPRSPVLAVALVLLAAVLPAAAQAAFPGKPGPIAYSKSFADETESAGGLFVHGPRVRDKARQLTRFDADGSPAYSADGRSLVFASNREPLGSTAYASHIYAIDAAGGNERQLTDGANYDQNPSFSPDGGQIVFDRQIGSSRTPHLFVVNSDGTGLRQLTSGTKADYEPTFTPDGRWIVFASNRNSDGEKNRSAIFKIRPAGGRPRVLVDTPRNDAEPDVSPNGRRVLFMSNRDGGLNMYTATIGGRGIRPVLKPVESCIRRSCYSNPAWSPDGKHIVARYSGRYSSSVVVLRADGRGFGRTFAEGGTEEEGYGTYIGAPCWGPAPR